MDAEHTVPHIIEKQLHRLKVSIHLVALSILSCVFFVFVFFLVIYNRRSADCSLHNYVSRSSLE